MIDGAVRLALFPKLLHMSEDIRIIGHVGRHVLKGCGNWWDVSGREGYSMRQGWRRDGDRGMRRENPIRTLTILYGVPVI